MPLFQERIKTKNTRFPIKIISILLCAVAVLTLAAGCSDSDTETEEVIPADYGTYGADIAKDIATRFPYRKAYSQGEKSTGELIRTAFQDLGYTVEEQVFPSSDNSGSSTNYVVRIPGEGFMIPDAGGTYLEASKSVIVGAHYDTLFGTLDATTVPNFDGIQDNAAGIGALLTLAKEIKDVRPGYDVILVAFGAGNDSFAGARYFLSQMTGEEVAAVDAMYCIESIYAGDKLYANAGLNSLAAGEKYAMRRKLYEAYDVVYETRLSSLYGVDLLYNQSGQLTNLDGDPDMEIFREVTITQSDYIPFDSAGIPIVFFESYDYNFSNIEEMKETKNLDLQENGGLIRRTNYDSLPLLELSLPDKQLEKRINATAFIILGAIEKGTHIGVSKSEYNQGITLAPSPTVASQTSETLIPQPS